jgi:hypothetical protein
MAIVTTAAVAWGPPGHTEVGAVADELLKENHPRAAAQIRAILGDITLAQAGPWGDCVRSVTGPADGFHYTPAPDFRPPCLVFEGGARQASMESYVRNNWSTWDQCKNERDGCHSQYHFVNMALQRLRYHFGDVGTRPYDIVQTMKAAITVLQTPDCSGPQPPDTTEVHAPGNFHFTCSQALMMLVHLIGDLHQPLHVGSIYLDEQGGRVDPDSSTSERARALDSKVTFNFGGNSLTWPNPGPRGGILKLHSVWDGIPSIPLSDSVAAARQVTPTTGSMDGWVEQWANDTLIQSRHAFEGLTFGSKHGNTWRVNFGNQDDYDGARERIQREQIAKGGARLAQLLATIWPD